MFTEPKRGGGGFFDVDWYKNFVAWLAWREWYHEEFGKTFFPQHQTTLFAWPPTSGENAETVRMWIKQLRLDVDSEPKKRGGYSCKAVPEFVSPWHQWDSSLILHISDQEIARREAWGHNFGLAPGSVRPDGNAPPGNYYPWRISFSMKFSPPMPMAGSINIPVKSTLRF